MQFFDATVGIKIPVFRASVTIEPGRSLLQFFTMNCSMNENTKNSFPTKRLKKLFFKIQAVEKQGSCPNTSIATN